MTKTIELAQQVGAFVDALYAGRSDNTIFTSIELERFAEIVRADERAAPCDRCVHKGDTYEMVCMECRHFYASYFQARGEG